MPTLQDSVPAMINKIQQQIKVFLWGTEIGTLSWNPSKDNSFFFFSPDYFRGHYDITPITHPKDAPDSHFAIMGENGNNGDPSKNIYQSLPPFLADSLPDKWGNAVFEEWFKSRGAQQQDKTPIAKLAFIGRRAMGALEFRPSQDIETGQVDIGELYKEALKYEYNLSQKEIPAGSTLTMAAFAAMGTSAGGRQMKAIISVADDGTIYSGYTALNPGLRHCIIKFNTPQYCLSETEMTYYDLAAAGGIDMMPSRLIEADGVRHFLTERFDREGGEKVFTQTLAAINPEADSYESLFATCDMLGLTYPEKEQLYRRTVFNFLMNNTDDHTKNFSFMMRKDGVWHLAPAYDMTFIISTNGIEPEGSHCISLGGKYYGITQNDLILFAAQQGIKNPQKIIGEIIAAARLFPEKAANNGVGTFFTNMICKRLTELCGVPISPGQDDLSVISKKGSIANNIYFRFNEKENRIILHANVNGSGKEVSFPRNNPTYEEILRLGMNNMPDREKKGIVQKNLLDIVDGREGHQD